MSEPIRLALIQGSTREGRLCDAVSGWVAGQIWNGSGFRIDEIDPGRLDLPHRHERSEGAAIRALRQRIEAADGFVVVTPEYNHGYPAALKFLIDSVHEEWQAKPVAFVSYGGLSGGLRAVEQLRQVFGELHAVCVRNGVALARPWDDLDGEGTLRPPVRQQAAMARMLEQLRWWAGTLREARRVDPYRRVA